MQFLPMSSTETVIREISYALPDANMPERRREMKAARHLNWRINRRVNAEDTELITRVQLGMQSPKPTWRGRWGRAKCACGASRGSSGGLIPEARLDSSPPAGWSQSAN